MKSNGISVADVEIQGVTPLLMHNAQKANPLNEWAMRIKQITSKHHTKKTEADEVLLVEYEFQGGLYYDDEIGPYLPSVVLEGCIRDGAKINKQGKLVSAGVMAEPDCVPLIYDGPRDRDKLFEEKRFVDVRPVKLKGSSTVMRTRPRFDKWSAKFQVSIFDDVISVVDVHRALENGGRLKGIGDFKPKFGRFIVKRFE